MEQDFPAAHSMDTHWFAVDRDGRVAVFDSNESGPVPRGARDEDPYGLLARIREWYPSPGSAAGLARIRYHNFAAEAARVGLFHFDYDEHERFLLGPYLRAELPAVALHVDQLPPDLRRQFKRFRFAELSFADGELVQLVEHFRDSWWHFEGSRVGYLCNDGRTVRPAPGRERGFAEFHQYFLAEYPERAREIVFDGPAEQPPTGNGGG